MEVENPGKWAISMLVGASLVAIGWRFNWLLVTLHVLICFLLVIVVLLQSGKAADLAGAFGGAGSQTAFGPRGAANFLSRATTWCAIMFMATSMTLVLRQASSPGSIGSIFERLGTKPATPANKPGPPGAPGTPVQVPVPAPQGQQAPASQNPFGQAPQQQSPAQTMPAQQTPAQQAPAQPPPAPAKKP